VNTQHAPAAAQAVLALQATLSKSTGQVRQRVTCGLASGRATVGNLGNASMQRFCIIGPVFSQAVHLERLAREKYGVPVLANADATREMQMTVFYEHVDLCLLPGAHRERIVSTFALARDVSNEEWMYQIEESRNSDPFAKVNHAFELLYAGNKAKAQDVVNSFLHEHGKGLEKEMMDTEKEQNLINTVSVNDTAELDSFIGLPYLQKRLGLL
jgi:hypothetical protein